MNPPDILIDKQWLWVVWTLLALVGALGLLAIFSPRIFSRLVTYSGKWVDSEKLLKKLDERVDVDHHVLRHCRLFGILVVAAAVVLVVLIT